MISSLLLAEGQISRESITGYTAIEKWNSPEFDVSYKNIDLEDDYIDLVNSLLSKQPWKPGIHNEIASKTKSPKEKVYRAIQILVKNGKRYNQKDGIIYDSKGNILEIDHERVDQKTLKLFTNLCDK